MSNGIKFAAVDPHVAIACTLAIEFEGGTSRVLFMYDEHGNYIRYVTGDTRIITGFELPSAWESACLSE